MKAYTGVRGYLVIMQLITLLLYQCMGIFMTKEECKHAGIPYNTPSIVNEFIQSKYSKNNAIQENDFLLHHNLVQEFCQSRVSKKKVNKKLIKKLKCSWLEVIDTNY